jgi:methionyl-tRNA formyltransferase
MADRLRVVFMGSPAFAVPCLEALLDEPAVEVVLVVTQPDRPAGRGQRLQPPPVKEVAARAGVTVLQPPSLKSPPFGDLLAPLEPDLGVVVAYGKILPADLLAVLRLGCWNVHGSVLPRWRGAAPIQRALLAGEAEAGVTLMQMDAGMDTGPVLQTHAIPVADDDTSGTLHDRLAPLGAALLLDGLGRLRAGTLVATPQDHARATLAPKIEKGEGRIEWTQPAARVRDRIRAVDPWPGAFTTVDGEPLKLWRPRLVSGGGPPGVVLGADRDGLLVACGEGAIAVGELQLPGRRRMAASALLSGRPIPAGSVLGR